MSISRVVRCFCLDVLLNWSHLLSGLWCLQQIRLSSDNPAVAYEAVYER
jgi:hypothetical protein